MSPTNSSARNLSSDAPPPSRKSAGLTALESLTAGSSDMQALFDSMDADDIEEEEADDEDVQQHAAGTHDVSWYTKDARKIWLGHERTRERPGKPGCQRLCQRLGRIIRGARADDPYALQLLQAIEYRIGAIGREKERQHQELMGLMSGGQRWGINYKGPNTSIYTPLTFEYSPRNAYARVIAELIGMFDLVTMVALEARNIGRINAHRFNEIKQRRPYAELVVLGLSYQFSGTTRQDFRDGNARARSATERLGLPPIQIIDEPVNLVLVDLEAPVHAPVPRDPLASSDRSASNPSEDN